VRGFIAFSLKKFSTTLFIISISFAGVSESQESEQEIKDALIELSEKNEETTEAISRLEKRLDDGEADFWSYFGVGASVQYHLNNGAPRIKDALVDSNGIVRINRESRANTGLLLEAHVMRKEYCLFFKNCKAGPFVAATPGSDNIIDNLGVGYMIQVPGGRGFSMNLGLGVSVNPNSQELRGTLEADQPLPEDFDASIGLTKETSRSQLMFVVSFSAD